LVITAGAWASQLLAGLGVSLQVKRKPLFWLACDEPRYKAVQGCPTFFYETELGAAFYGFPVLDSLGLKIAEHSGGEVIADPLRVDRTQHSEDVERVVTFAQQHLPGVSSRVTDHAICLYTMSPDEHFILDVHPEHPQVCFAAGLSGHGFKFTSVLGELMADLAQHGHSELPSGFLSLKRFA
jgi:glycine/D-amino acid oxidase-like deaminating enzyme